MMLTCFTTKRRGAAPLLRAVLFGAALVLPAAGCEGILEVDDPDVTSRDLLNTPEAVPSLRAGAISDFTVGYEQLINLGGMLADEFIFSETFPTRLVVDARTIGPDNATLLTLFAQVATANASPEFSATRIGEIRAAFPDATGLHDEQAEALNLTSFAKVAIAEHYCEGVPLSRLTVNGQAIEFDYGSPLTRAQMLDSAIAGFDRARTVLGSGNSVAEATQRNLAIVGRARAMLNQGDFAGVLAFLTANPVATTFTYQLQHSNNSAGENNAVWNFNSLNERVSVANREGINGVPFRVAVDSAVSGQPHPGGQDPRVIWIRNPANNVGFDNSTPQFNALKYPDRPAFTVLASGVEATLMVAEAHLRAGNPGAMRDSLNSLRARVQPLMQLLNFDYVNQQGRVGYAAGQGATLPPLTLPATAAEQRALLFKERAMWLAFTAHRVGDLRRLVRQYGLDQSVVFPSGQHHKGIVYGTDVNFPIPIQEANNPNAPEAPDAQCMNRNA